MHGIPIVGERGFEGDLRFLKFIPFYLFIFLISRMK